MASESKTAKKKGQSKKDDIMHEGFNVSHYLMDEVELPVDKLALDIDMKQGQIHTVNAAHREELVQEFLKNPPMRIELTTVLDQSVPASAPVCQVGLQRGWG